MKPIQTMLLLAFTFNTVSSTSFVGAATGLGTITENMSKVASSTTVLGETLEDRSAYLINLTEYTLFLEYRNEYSWQAAAAKNLAQRGPTGWFPRIRNAVQEVFKNTKVTIPPGGTGRFIRGNCHKHGEGIQVLKGFACTGSNTDTYPVHNVNGCQELKFVHDFEHPPVESDWSLKMQVKTTNMAVIKEAQEGSVNYDPQHPKMLNIVQVWTDQTPETNDLREDVKIRAAALQKQWYDNNVLSSLPQIAPVA